MSTRACVAQVIGAEIAVVFARGLRLISDASVASAITIANLAIRAIVFGAGDAFTLRVAGVWRAFAVVQIALATSGPLARRKIAAWLTLLRQRIALLARIDDAVAAQARFVTIVFHVASLWHWRRCIVALALCAVATRAQRARLLQRLGCARKQIAVCVFRLALIDVVITGNQQSRVLCNVKNSNFDFGANEALKVQQFEIVIAGCKVQNRTLNELRWVRIRIVDNYESVEFQAHAVVVVRLKSIRAGHSNVVRERCIHTEIVFVGAAWKRRVGTKVAGAVAAALTIGVIDDIGKFASAVLRCCFHQLLALRNRRHSTVDV